MIRRLLALLLLLAGTLPATAAELRSGWYAGEPQQFVQRRDGRERLTGVDIEMVHAIARPGDFVVCLGAGNITQWAAALPAELQKLQAGQKARPAGAA